jgi:hypothetical protein
LWLLKIRRWWGHVALGTRWRLVVSLTWTILPPGDEPSVPTDGLMGARADLDILEKRKISILLPGIKSGIIQPLLKQQNLVSPAEVKSQQGTRK